MCAQLPSVPLGCSDRDGSRSTPLDDVPVPFCQGCQRETDWRWFTHTTTRATPPPQALMHAPSLIPTLPFCEWQLHSMGSLHGASLPAVLSEVKGLAQLSPAPLPQPYSKSRWAAGKEQTTLQLPPHRPIPLRRSCMQITPEPYLTAQGSVRL